MTSAPFDFTLYGYSEFVASVCHDNVLPPIVFWNRNFFAAPYRAGGAGGEQPQDPTLS